MNQKTKYWYLSKFNLIQRLNKKELMYLNDSSLMKNYASSDVLVHQYDNKEYIYFIKKGTLKVSRINNDGNELLSYLIPQGTIFGLTQLLTDNYDGNEKIVAMENCIICKVSIQIFKELMDQNNDLNNHILKLSGLRIKRLERRLENVIFKTSEERIREFIAHFSQEYGINKVDYYEANLFINNKDIASLTNTNRQKVNQIMNTMKKEGTIDFDRKSIKYFIDVNHTKV